MIHFSLLWPPRADPPVDLVFGMCVAYRLDRASYAKHVSPGGNHSVMDDRTGMLDGLQFTMHP